MAEFKIVLGFKEGKCVQREVKDEEAASLIGKKVGEKIEGNLIGLEGYELEITGGSDNVGFPMRMDVKGNARKRILAVSGVGLKKKEKGIRQRKTVAGRTIHADISQINFKVLKVGKENLLKAAEKKPEGAEGDAKPEDKKEEKPAEKKEEPKKEEAKEEKPKAEEKKEPAKEEKPKDDKPAEKKE